MALSDRLKQGFLRLPSQKKAVLLSSLGLSICALLPWLTAKNIVEEVVSFSGISGPLYVIGLVTLGLGLINFVRLFLPLLHGDYFHEKPYGKWTAFVGAQSSFLLFLTWTIFSAPSFASELINKTLRYGFFGELFFSGLLLFFGILLYRSEVKTSPRSEELAETAPNEEPSSPTPDLLQTPVGDLGVDPLSLDPKERYRLLRARQGISQEQSSPSSPAEATSSNEATKNWWQK